MEPLLSGRAFWHGKNVFLTGHTGFKGSWLALVLHTLGARLHGYALPPEPDALYQAARIGDIMAASTVADLADRIALDRAMARSGADIVIHMAAQPLVRHSFSDPVGTYMTNVMGTVHVLDALRRNPWVRAALCVTSDKCYENREWVRGYREDEPMGGFDPYSSSKGCAELAVAAFRRSYFTTGSCQLASARAGNVIGGGDWAKDRLVPDLVRGLRAGAIPPIRNPTAVRPWQHVLDALGGYLHLVRKLYEDDSGQATFARGWNFGPCANDERPVHAVADAVCRRWSPHAKWQTVRDRARHEAHSLKLDTSRTTQLLGWKPVWSFEETMNATIRWYRQHAEGADMADFTTGQIIGHLSRATQREGSLS